jgi:dolichol-phosphate mannosyltransferase
VQSPSPPQLLPRSHFTTCDSQGGIYPILCEHRQSRIGAARSDSDAPLDRFTPIEFRNVPGRGAPELAVVIPTLNEHANIPILVERLARALNGIAWEVIFVDDDSVDGTMDKVRRLGASDARIRGIRRVARRGLAGAALEGMLSTSAEFVVVMDGDLQHDETRIAQMLSLLRNHKGDVVVASRYCEAGQEVSGLSELRRRGSRLATYLASKILKTTLSDPMSGFFAIRREVVDHIARKLSPQGFKILLDILTSSPSPLRVQEIPFSFRPRLYGESKLDSAVVLEYLGLFLSKASAGLVSVRFFMFALVGLSGVVMNLSVLALLLSWNVRFVEAQTAAVLSAMTSNFFLNNALTYRDRRLRGWRLFAGLISFAALCSLGVAAAVGVPTLLYHAGCSWWLAGLASAVMGALWNYIATATFTWRAP